MEVGADVWYKDKTDGWSPSKIIAKSDTTGQIRFTVQKVKTREEFVIVANLNADIDTLKLMNTTEESEVENLINLPFLHEPAILYCLELRYFRSQIYTYTGPILIAVNPFKKVDLYSDQLLAKYYNSGLSKAQGMAELGPPLAPHPYAIADAAYRLMMSAIQSGYGSANAIVADQSILISGESGAGKTESTKIVLKYLTTVACETLQFQASEGTVMDKVLKSNPILEALGNAKTIRNDNSSRFGKFIELNFDKRGHLIGGFIRTYLLEKIRLTSQQANERCFHIFYQIAAGGSTEDKLRWDVKSMNDFHYANQGNAVVVAKMDDKAECADLLAALHTLRFLPENQKSMFDIIAGILHLGQVKFIPDKDGEGSELGKDASNATSLETSLRLLGLPNKEFVKTVTERTIVARNEKYQKKLTSVQASDARDSIARIVYGKLFDWVVATINKEIKTSDPSAIKSEIGVLDIFGFECLKENSFEQLCINYTNETLQQQFNQFVFKMEQEEYTREEIEWSFVSFPDNQDCIDLIDLKKKSIFSVLDDECMLAGGTDVKFASRMITELGSYDRFSVSASQKTSQQFCINHYAGEVVYSTATFVDKNRDELPKEAIDLMGLSSVELLRYIFSPANQAPSAVEADTASKREGRSALGSPTICTQFKAQLTSLISKIHATKPHYIRCLKPNDLNKPDNLNRIRTTEQLRYGGVLEAVRVARSGFPVRLTHEDFYGRYRPLANPFNVVSTKMARYLPPPSGNSKADAVKSCNDLLALMWDDSTPKPAPTDKAYQKTMRKIAKVDFWRGKATKIDLNSIQLGKSKVFFRKQAHDFFEGRRSRYLVVAARSIQAVMRGWLTRVWFRKAIASVRRLQIAIRYFTSHRRFVKRRRLHASIKIQTAYRQRIHYQRFRKFVTALLSVQKCYRGKLARRVVEAMLTSKYATKVQANVRKLVWRFRYRSYLRAVIATQNKFRMGIAKRSLRELRIAAKDIGNLKQSNEALKLEIERLKASAAQETARTKLTQHEEEEAKMKEHISRAAEDYAAIKRQLEDERRLRREVEAKLDIAEATVVAEIKARSVFETRLEDKEAALKEREATIHDLTAQVSVMEAQIRETNTSPKAPRSPRSPVPGPDNGARLPYSGEAESRTPILDAPPSAGVLIGDGSGGASEAQMAAVLSNYISLAEHERVVKQLSDESAVLRRTISKNPDAQQELLRQFQRKKPAEESAVFTAPPQRGILKSRSVSAAGTAELLRSKSDEHERERERSVSFTPLGSPNSAGEPRSPLKTPMLGQTARAKSMGAAELLKSLKTPEGIAALKNELSVDPTPEQQEDGTWREVDAAEFGYRPSPHADHMVKKKAPLKASSDDVLPPTPQQSQSQSHESDPRMHKKVFDQNLEHFKTRFAEGFSVVAHTPGNAPYDCLLTLEKPALIHFTPPARRSMSWFAPKKSAHIVPISVYDIHEVSSGMSRDAIRTFNDISESARNEGHFVTVTFSAHNGKDEDEYTSKFVLLKFNNPHDRNTLLTGVRSLLNDIQLKMTYTPAGSAAGTPASRSVSFTPPPSKTSTHDDSSELRASYELLIVQLFSLTNDLHEREDELAEMRKREEILVQLMKSKEQMYEQDAIVRMQLGKRLEQVLMDKEEIKDQCESLQAQLAAISALTSNKVPPSPGSPFTPHRTPSKG